MIQEKTPVTMAEANEIIKDLEEKKELQAYMKKFIKLKKDKADKLMEDVRNLKNMKVKEEHIVKVADFVPKEKEELNKIFSDVTLTEEETNAILEITGKY